jgi:hypothetical protein
MRSHARAICMSLERHDHNRVRPRPESVQHSFSSHEVCSYVCEDVFKALRSKHVIGQLAYLLIYVDANLH